MMVALSPIGWLFAGIGVLLVVATAIGRALAARARRRSGEVSPTLRNLNARIDAWWMLVLVVGGAFLLGEMAVIALFALLSFQALREVVNLTPARRADQVALAVAFFVIVPGQYGFVATESYGMLAIFVPVYGFLLVPSIQALASDTTDFLSRSARLQWGLMVAVYCLSHVPALLLLRFTEPRTSGALLLLFLLLVVQLSDVFQYVWGKLLGRRRIAPQVSPGKTVEGFVGGVLSASAVGAALWWITPFSWWQAGLLSLVSTVMGFLGGLVLSAIKRDRGIKDWGHLIAGHGGVLDRLDSVCFAAPIFFHLTRFAFAT